MKLIVIGTSLSGKTTLVKYLKANTKYPISEVDEELTNLNGGKFPEDEILKKKLAKLIIDKVINSQEVIFFTNTDYFEVEDLVKAKKYGYKIILIIVPLEILKIRNNERMENEGYADMSDWLDGMVEYQETILENGLIDVEIDGQKSTNEIAEIIINA